MQSEAGAAAHAPGAFLGSVGPEGFAEDAQMIMRGPIWLRLPGISFGERLLVAIPDVAEDGLNPWV